jgi:sarcosine oxidase
VNTIKPYDVIVAGLGAMGSATAFHLARKGQHILGLDRWEPGHAFGSSHGDSRIIRQAYYEHPLYVPLVQRADVLWHELQQRTGRTLFTETGGLMIGHPEGEIVAGSLQSAQEFGLEHEVLSPSEVLARYPAFHLRDDELAILDPRAGILAPEECNAAHITAAREFGVEMQFNTPILRWTPDGDGVRVETPHETYHAGSLLLTVGARTNALLPGLELPLKVERQTLFWFEPDASSAALFDAARCPIYLYEYKRGRMCYGFPRLSRGVKAAIMHEGMTFVDPDRVPRGIGEDEALPVRRSLRALLPDLASARVRDSAVCLFTNTPDLHFLIDFHPAHPQVLISSPCSGHGFKFASVIGELQAELLTTGRLQFDLAPFGLQRFAAKG